MTAIHAALQEHPTSEARANMVCSVCSGALQPGEDLCLDERQYDATLHGEDWSWRHRRCVDDAPHSIEPIPAAPQR